MTEPLTTEDINAMRHRLMLDVGLTVAEADRLCDAACKGVEPKQEAAGASEFRLPDIAKGASVMRRIGLEEIRKEEFHRGFEAAKEAAAKICFSEWHGMADEIRALTPNTDNAAGSVSRRAALNCEPSGVTVQNGLKPQPTPQQEAEPVPWPAAYEALGMTHEPSPTTAKGEDYETGYREGESSANADWFMAIIEFNDFLEPEDISPRKIADLIQSLKEERERIFEAVHLIPDDCSVDKFCEAIATYQKDSIERDSLKAKVEKLRAALEEYKHDLEEALLACRATISMATRTASVYAAKVKQGMLEGKYRQVQDTLSQTEGA